MLQRDCLGHRIQRHARRLRGPTRQLPVPVKLPLWFSNTLQISHDGEYPFVVVVRPVDGNCTPVLLSDSGPEFRLFLRVRWSGPVLDAPDPQGPCGRVTLNAPNRPIEGGLQMTRETATKIMAAMKEMVVALDKVHDALCQIENEEVRKRILTKYYHLANDAHGNIAMEVVKYFPELHPKKSKI